MRATSVHNVKSVASGIPSSLADLPPEVQWECLIEELTRLDRAIEDTYKPRCPACEDVSEKRRSSRLRNLKRMTDADLLDLLCQYHAALRAVLTEADGSNITLSVPYLERQRSLVLRTLFDRHRTFPAKRYRYDKDAIKDRVSIETVIGSYVELEPYGKGKLRGLCPFHKDTDPSLVVYVDNDSWACFGCRTGGDVFNFIMRMENVGFYEAVKLADTYF